VGLMTLHLQAQERRQMESGGISRPVKRDRPGKKRTDPRRQAA